MEFELIWLDGWLNWPSGNIFRQDSKPKPLQTHQHLLENTKNHPPKKSPKDQKRPDFWKPIFPQKRQIPVGFPYKPRARINLQSQTDAKSKVNMV